MISTHFSLPVSLLLVLTLVPTIIHTYSGAVFDDGLTTKAIGNSHDAYKSEPTTRNAAWVERTFDTTDWLERIYTGPEGKNILLFAARSYNLKKLYHHPEIGIIHGTDLEKTGITRLGETGDIPVHLFRGRTGGGIAGYALLYDGIFIENPVKLQLQTSFEQLFSLRKNITLFFVYDSRHPRNVQFEPSPSAEILQQAINSFRNQKR